MPGDLVLFAAPVSINSFLRQALLIGRIIGLAFFFNAYRRDFVNLSKLCLVGADIDFRRNFIRITLFVSPGIVPLFTAPNLCDCFRDLAFPFGRFPRLDFFCNVYRRDLRNLSKFCLVGVDVDFRRNFVRITLFESLCSFRLALPLMLLATGF